MLISSDDDDDGDTYCHHEHSLLQILCNDSVYRMNLYDLISLVSPSIAPSLSNLLPSAPFSNYFNTDASGKEW
jgi:hypothetical protein